MRVLLFVDGPKGPKCIKAASSWTYNGDYLNTVPPLSVRVCMALVASDRWWLVECESAEAGRRVINYARIGIEVPWHEGRILASSEASR